MESLLSAVADYLMRQSVQIAALFLLVAAACWGLRNTSAHWRYLLWLVVLAKCLVPPLVSVPLAVLPPASEPQPATAVAIDSAEPLAQPPEMPMPASPRPAAAPAVAPDMILISPEPIAIREEASRPAAPAQPDAGAASALWRAGWDWRAWLALAWCAGVAACLAHVSIRAWTTHRRLKRVRRAADPEIQAMVAALGARLGLKALPTVYMADRIAQPFVWGWLAGSIYLPEQFLGTGTRQQQQAILTHELAHVARWDAAANFVQIVAQAAFFFHPLVWWTNRQIRREREKCCDETVIAGLGADPKQYGQAIVNAIVAEYEASRSIPSLAVAGRVKHIEERIRTILNPKRRFCRRPSWAAVATASLLAACSAPTAMVLTARGGAADQQPARASQPAPPTQPARDAAAATKDKLPTADAKAGTWAPGQVLDFRMVNARTKEPLPGVKLELQFHGPGIDFQDVKVQFTDAEGRSRIRLPDRRPDAVRVYPSKAGFVPLRVYWGDDLPSPKLPKSVTVPMEPGTIWGGVVRSESGEPIPNVKVCVHYWEKGKEFNPHLRANLTVEDTVRTTDKDGRWQLDVMPASFDGDGPRLYLTHPDYVSDHLQRGHIPRPITERPSYEALRARTAVMVLRKGATITGRVTDGSGKPISGALISNQYDAYDTHPLRITATTDKEGHFRLSGLSHRQNYRDYFFTVQAAGYAPVFVEVSDYDAAKPVEVKLQRGQAVQGQVVDEDGKPLEGVSITLDYWMGRPRQFHLRTTTGADGRFRIDDAPLERTEYDFRKQSYITVRKPLPPRTEEYRIALRPPLKIVGSILDAETNRPLAKCTVTKGWDPDNRAPEWETQIGMPARTITDGRYEFTVTGEQWLTRIRVEADGYMPAVSRLFKPYDPDRGVVTYDFRMKKAAPMSGTVLGLDGRPLAGAEVFLAKQQFHAENGAASANARRTSRMVKSDANGQFRFPPEVEPFYLIVLHEQGHIVLDEQQFAKTPTVRIEPWPSANRSLLLQRKQNTYIGGAPEKDPQTLNVRIVDAEGKPVADASVASSAEFRAGYNYLGDNEPAWDYFRNVLSDRDGRARLADQGRIDCVVARHSERKLVAIQAISPEQARSSETVTITLQPQCKVFGRLTAKGLEAHNRKLQWSNVYVHLDSGFTRPMSCASNRADFHFYLPPGTYTLDAYATDTQHARKTITIRPGQQELQVEPIDLPPTGLVLLEGKPAPELRDVIAWKNGGPVKLSDLRGKVVVLAFSSHWVANRPHQWMPNLFTICDKYGDRGLAVIEIRIDIGIGIDMGLGNGSQAKLDEKIAEVKSPFWSDRDLPVPIALGLLNRPPFLDSAAQRKASGQPASAILSDYGVNSFPSGVLIDRRGRVVGKFDLRSERDNAVLERLLNEK